VERHLPALRPRVLATDASIENLQMVADGRADVAFTLADAASDAVRGKGRFPRPLPVVALARLYDNYVQIVVRADSPIRSVAQLAGRRVSVGPSGSGTRLVAERILDIARLSSPRALRRVRLDVAASAKALAAGRVDAFFWSGGLPTRAISDLRRSTAIRLVGLGGLAARLRERHDDLYAETVVPRAAYALSSAVTTVSVPNYLVVRRDFDGEAAYRLTRALFLRRADIERSHPEAARLNLRAAIATYPLDLHPGAVRWFREAHR
jgi:TRAP transporter TAXI family solute receptor